LFTFKLLSQLREKKKLMYSLCQRFFCVLPWTRGSTFFSPSRSLFRFDKPYPGLSYKKTRVIRSQDSNSEFGLSHSLTVRYILYRDYSDSFALQYACATYLNINIYPHARVRTCTWGRYERYVRLCMSGRSCACKRSRIKERENEKTARYNCDERLLSYANAGEHKK
jgi:hypothetical protein